MNKLYNRYFKEITMYRNYFTKYWNMSENGTSQSLNEFEVNKALGAFFSKDGKRVFITIKDNYLLIHVYYDDNNKNIKEKDRTIYEILSENDEQFNNTMVDISWYYSEEHDSPTLLGLLKQSEKREFEVNLKVCAGTDNTNLIRYGTDGENILKDMFLKNKYIEPYTEFWYKLIPKFIHFADNYTIKKWWEHTKETAPDIFKIAEYIKNGPEYNKFKTVIDDKEALDTGASMGELGFK